MVPSRHWQQCTFFKVTAGTPEIEEKATTGISKCEVAVTQADHHDGRGTVWLLLVVILAEPWTGIGNREIAGFMKKCEVTVKLT